MTAVEAAGPETHERPLHLEPQRLLQGLRARKS